MHLNVFNQLIVGLAQWEASDDLFPPPMLSHALNTVCAPMQAQGSFPKTRAGLKKLLETSVSSWYPLQLPPEFAPGASLCYDGILSEEAGIYLAEIALPATDPRQIQSPLALRYEMDDRRFEQILHKLREKATPKAQSDYIALREFLLREGHTRRERIARAFRTHLFGEMVGPLYGDDNLPPGEYFQCDFCGPLEKRNGRLLGMRPDVCGDHREGLPHVHKVVYFPDLCRLLPGVQKRVLIPGIAERALFDGLETLNQQFPGGLVIERWPGIDIYDARITFTDEISWAVDVKDYQSPHRLGRELKPIPAPGRLTYNQGFYVVPDARVRVDPSYLPTAAGVADPPLPHTHALLALSPFVSRVETKLRALLEK